MRLSGLRFVVGLVLAPLPVFAFATVHEFMLDNGLKVIVKEDHRAPVVVSQIWYKVGASYEHSGITGISHVLEHMMFKGTNKYGPGQFSRIVAAQGGRENAFTGRDYTSYFQQLEKTRLPVSFELEADRMRNLVLLADEFAKEVQVVMEERRLRTEDNPQSLTAEQFRAVAYLSSPYHHPIIGWMDDLQNLTVDDLQRWYTAWYAPDNATLVVAGDVEPAEVLALAREHYGTVRAAENASVAKPRREVRQRGLRRVQVKAPAELPYLLMGYKVPSLATAEDDWEAYALEVLAGVLDGGASARLARELVRGKQVAASAGAGYDLYARLGTLMLLSGTPANGGDIATVESALRAQIQRLQTDLVHERELRRIKAQVVADDVFEKDSVFYQAMQIGQLETVGLGWRRMDEYVHRVRAVTAEQVRAVARKYLVDDALTVAVLDPLPMDTGEGKDETATGGSDAR